MGAADVITSYSIHYTKLYDYQPAVFVDDIDHVDRFAVPAEAANLAKSLLHRPFRLQCDIVRSDEAADAVFRVTEQTFRITSYNVCYTKLLRR